jgi:site-specific recombinase XerD
VPAAPLSRNAEEFLSWLEVERGRSPRTLSSYRQDLRAYQAYLGDGPTGVSMDQPM